MKSIFLLSIGLAGAVSASARTQSIPTAQPAIPQLEVAPRSIEVVRPGQPQRKAAANADIQLLESYTVDAVEYHSNTGKWDPAQWVTTPGIEDYYGIIQYPVFYDLLPPGTFSQPLGLEYTVEDNRLVFAPTAITQYEGDYYIFAIDANDYTNGGTGAIVLEVGADGSLSQPEDRRDHTLGYFVCKMGDSYEPVGQPLGAFVQVADLQFSGQAKAEPAELTGEVRDITIQANATWDDLTADYGLWQLVAYNDEYLVTICSMNATTTAGEYSKDQLEAKYTYISVWDGTDYVQIDAADMNASIQIDDITGIVTGQLWVREWTTGIIWHATLTHNPALPTPMSYDEETPVEMNFAVADIQHLEYIEEGSLHYYYLSAVNAQADAASLYFFVDGADADGLIPEGVYTVSATHEPGTILQSEGVNSSFQVSPSYAAKIDAEGMIEQVWFIVDGSATVQKVEMTDGLQLFVELKAINSYCQPVHLTIGEASPAVSLHRVAADQAIRAQKILRQGRVSLLSGNKAYTVAGFAE